ncbi:MAG: lasso peptide biosynthesis B2 protein [Nitriliruptorales bacterium]
MTTGAQCEADSERGWLALGIGSPRPHYLVTAVRKVGLAAKIWYSFLVVSVGLRRLPLPKLVERLGRKGPAGSGPPPSVPRVGQASVRRLHEPAWLGQVVWKVLRVGRWRPRCLHTSLVLLRLLRQQGRPAELVIGLPPLPTSRDAHAWVEVEGADVGPPPGRAEHRELARYA